MTNGPSIDIMPDQENNAEQFLNLIRQSRRGKFKIYIGMSAGWQDIQDATGIPYIAEKRG